MSLLTRLSQIAGVALYLGSHVTAHVGMHPPVCPTGRPVVEVLPAELIVTRPVNINTFCPRNTKIAINNDVTITVANAPTHVVTQVTCVETIVTTFTNTVTVPFPWQGPWQTQTALGCNRCHGPISVPPRGGQPSGTVIVSPTRGPGDPPAFRGPFNTVTLDCECGGDQPITITLPPQGRWGRTGTVIVIPATETADADPGDFTTVTGGYPGTFTTTKTIWPTRPGTPGTKIVLCPWENGRPTDTSAGDGEATATSIDGQSGESTGFGSDPPNTLNTDVEELTTTIGGFGGEPTSGNTGLDSSSTAINTVEGEGFGTDASETNAASTDQLPPASSTTDVATFSGEDPDPISTQSGTPSDDSAGAQSGTNSEGEVPATQTDVEGPDSTDLGEQSSQTDSGEATASVGVTAGGQPTESGGETLGGQPTDGVSNTEQFPTNSVSDILSSSTNLGPEPTDSEEEPASSGAATNSVDGDPVSAQTGAEGPNSSGLEQQPTGEVSGEASATGLFPINSASDVLSGNTDLGSEPTISEEGPVSSGAATNSAGGDPVSAQTGAEGPNSTGLEEQPTESSGGTLSGQPTESGSEIPGPTESSAETGTADPLSGTGEGSPAAIDEAEPTNSDGEAPGTESFVSGAESTEADNNAEETGTGAKNSLSGAEPTGVSTGAEGTASADETATADDETATAVTASAEETAPAETETAGDETATAADETATAGTESAGDTEATGTATAGDESATAEESATAGTAAEETATAADETATAGTATADESATGAAEPSASASANTLVCPTLPEPCAALEDVNGLVLAGLAPLCLAALGIFGVGDLAICLANLDFTSVGTDVVLCLETAMEPSCLDGLPESCEALVDLEAEDLVTNLPICTAALGPFALGAAGVCVTSGLTNGNDVIGCLETALGF